MADLQTFFYIPINPECAFVLVNKAVQNSVLNSTNNLLRMVYKCTYINYILTHKRLKMDPFFFRFLIFQ